jgi:hypothetical protein
VRDLLRTLALLIIIPVGALLIGPALVLAAVRRAQPIGPITLRALPGGGSGRLVTACIGLMLWAVVWGGLTVLVWPIAGPALVTLSAAPHVVAQVEPTAPVMPVPDDASPALQAMPSPMEAAGPPTEGNAGSAPPAPTATPSPTPTDTVTPSPTMTNTPSPSPTATDTPTPSPTPTDTAEPTSTPVPSPTYTLVLPTAVPPTATPSPTSTPRPADTPWPTPTPWLTPTPPPTATARPTDTPAPPPTDTPNALTQSGTPGAGSTPTATADAVPPPETVTISRPPTPLTVPTTPTPGGAGPPALPIEVETPAPSPTPTPPPPVLLPLSPTPTDAMEVEAIAAVASANELLRLAVEQPTTPRLAALAEHWRERALPKAQAFARAMYYRVGKPVTATYVYLVPPTASHAPDVGQMRVDAIEVWTYQGGILIYTEHFQFHYTLTQQDGRWVIVDYTYRNAPTPASPAYGKS